MKFVKPDFKNSVLNVSATLADFLGAKNDIPKIELLKDYLNKDYKNVIYICLDALGIYPLKQNLTKDSFLRTHIKKKITSVFPATTTNATTSLQCALYPSQHGWFGWSLYFEKANRCVEIFLDKDYYTGEKIDLGEEKNILTFNPYFDRCKTDYQLNLVVPEYVKENQNTYYYKTVEEMFDSLQKICDKKGKQFIYCYHSEPDATMHLYGVTSKEASKVIQDINDRIEKFSKNNEDTLVIITPDHGQTDINGYIELYKDKELLNTLNAPYYLDSRAVSFRVKDNMDKEFKKAFKKHRKELKLFKTQTLIDKNYFGPKTDKLKLLGDYIGVVKDKSKAVMSKENGMKLKGNHSGLTKREMILPLIIIEMKKEN